MKSDSGIGIGAASGLMSLAFVLSERGDVVIGSILCVGSSSCSSYYFKYFFLFFLFLGFNV